MRFVDGILLGLLSCVLWLFTVSFNFFSSKDVIAWNGVIRLCGNLSSSCTFLTIWLNFPPCYVCVLWRCEKFWKKYFAWLTSVSPHLWILTSLDIGKSSYDQSRDGPRVRRQHRTVVLCSQCLLFWPLRRWLRRRLGYELRQGRLVVKCDDRGEWGEKWIRWPHLCFCFRNRCERNQPGLKIWWRSCSFLCIIRVLNRSHLYIQEGKEDFFCCPPSVFISVQTCSCSCPAW